MQGKLKRSSQLQTVGERVAYFNRSNRLKLNTITEIKTKAAHKTKASTAFRTRADLRRYWLLLAALLVASGLIVWGLLIYNNPVAIDSPSALPVIRRRFNAVTTMMIVAVCQGTATVAFQTITQNRIITPSLLGFEALYTAIQTATVYFFGLTALVNFSGNRAFIILLVLMVGLSVFLYGSLLKEAHDLQRMLLIGIVLGSGLRSISTFMRRMLDPSSFDVLQARMFGSVNNADPESFPLAIFLVCVAVALLWAHSERLNILALGRDITINLGEKPRYSIIYTLILIAILMSVSTALLGSINFLGFLAATLTYQWVPTYDHRYLFPMVVVISFVILAGAYFLMYHVFNAQGVVALIIELVGGVTFLSVLLKRGKA